MPNDNARWQIEVRSIKTGELIVVYYLYHLYYACTPWTPMPLEFFVIATRLETQKASQYAK